MRWSLAVGFLLSGLIYVHILRPLPLLPPAKDPTSQTRGWAELAAEVDALRTSRGACWVATTSYATTGQLAYQLDAKTPVIELTDRIRYVHLPRVDDALFKCPGALRGARAARQAGAAEKPLPDGHAAWAS